MIKDDVLKSFSKSSVLVTGGTGLIGRSVVEMLAGAGAALRVVSLDKIEMPVKADFVYGDLTDFDFCKKITQGMDCVFHLAGIKGSI